MLMLRLIVLGTFLLCLAACEKAGTPNSPKSDGAAASSLDSVPIAVLTKSGVEMVYLPGDEFIMGTDRGSPDEAPAHNVKLTAFLMDTFEVTQEMFNQVQLPNPSHWQENGRKPVERVRWRDAKRYCNERSLLEQLKPCYNEKTVDWDCDYSANGYRLPTEAEWEYACRAGKKEPYDFERVDKLRQYAWFSEDAEQQTHIVGQKKPNGYGLYDLYGNVSEWCEDVYSPTYYKDSPVNDPVGPPSPGKDVKRVIRGGNWKSSAEQCRATARQGERTGNTDACFSTDFCGFRCVRRVTPGELEVLKKGPRSG
jgi:formylglycine-generating enzyme